MDVLFVLYQLKKLRPTEVNLHCCVSDLCCADEQRESRKTGRLLDISTTLVDTAGWVNIVQPCNLFHCSFTFRSQSQIDTNWTVQLFVFCDRPLSNRVANEWCFKKIWQLRTGIGQLRTGISPSLLILFGFVYALFAPESQSAPKIIWLWISFAWQSLNIDTFLECLKYFSFHRPAQDDLLESSNLIFTGLMYKNTIMFDSELACHSSTHISINLRIYEHVCVRKLLSTIKSIPPENYGLRNWKYSLI